eukprot:Phypoly_transcript_14743.p1 GENE.Phypoly_transcript_14743~~Phypoly_transcript_14743.p1  ORF type:complete len:254 (+),score=31.52 Phypoly_transcript_14743:199-960(+)
MKAFGRLYSLPKIRQCSICKAFPISYRYRTFYSDARRQSELWLAPGSAKNKYKVPLFVPDLHTLATPDYTSDARRKFAQLRHSDGSEYSSHKFHYSVHAESLRYKIPHQTEQSKKLANTEFSGPIYQAEEMDEKWDVFKKGQFLFFVRSLNGLPCFKVQIMQAFVVGDHLQLEVGDIYYTSDLEETKEKKFVEQMVDFLIKTHLVRDPTVVAPLPSFLIPDNDQAILQYISKIYGVHAKCATFGDTVNIETKP